MHKNTFYVGLLRSNSQAVAISVSFAFYRGLSTERYNELASAAGKFVMGFSDLRPMWAAVDDHIKDMHLNDVDGPVYGAILAAVMGEAKNPVIFGKALVNNDEEAYAKCMAAVEECPK